MATETAESVVEERQATKKTKKKSLQAHRGSRRRMGCPNYSTQALTRNTAGAVANRATRNTAGTVANRACPQNCTTVYIQGFH